MDATHAKHLRATEAVEALWAEQESRDATYRIANASIQDSRDVVHQIAYVLPQMESSECLEPDEARQIANVLPQMESSEFLEPKLSQMESRQTKGPVVKHLRELLTTAVELHQIQSGGGIIESPLDMFVSSRDGETCMGGNGTCCGMVSGVSGVSGSVEIHSVSGSW